ncbi:hypothetical protein ONE63_001869 [Megalurothrips usitatus]|uniref:Uncharacterized protein n=1 Tax=Megalurothrips usitatus TaxID=439358 RepID=A0AAV7XAR9_9NEOP|nr:hypothetical protein ONE63_001869 [Megalurothrips usitatus]
MTALAETVRFQWSAKEPEDLTNLDLAALNHILCGFNASDLVRVHAAAYKDAASSLSLLRCPGMPGAAPVPGVGAPGADSGLPSLRALAALAQSGDAFGDPGGWSAGTVRAIGCVLVGLPTAAVGRVPTASMHAMLQALAGSEQAVIRHCLYGTPVIAQVRVNALLP